MRDFHLPGRSPVFATNGMAATSHPLGSSVAIDTLKAGGNAIDAAIAGAVVLGLCEPQSTGIGGDLFALFSPAGTDEVYALNGSGRAPAGLNPGTLRATGAAKIDAGSPHSVTIPGALDAFCRLSEDWGLLGLDRVLAPAIHYAEAGVPVAPRVAFDWAGAAENLQGAARGYFLNDGAAPSAGQIFRAPGQAKVLRRVAAAGRAGFYEGDVAQDMVEALSAFGGTHTIEDFAATEASTGTPVAATYKTAQVLEHPPNAQGATALLILNILAQFDLAGMDPNGPNRAHIEAEASKLAYAKRDAIIADPEFTARLAEFTDPDVAAALAGRIDPARVGVGPPRAVEATHKDTIYITVVDRDRMAVSLIYSIFRSFGAGIASEKYGILLHNRGSGFTLTKGHANEAGPGKRPMHTIIPGMVRRGGHVSMPFGVMGGQYQAAGHARFITNIEDFGFDPQTAIDGPRAFAYDGALRIERGYSDAARARLAEMGHKLVVPEVPIGGAQAIVIHRETGTLEGASDPRKDGCALGY